MRPDSAAAPLSLSRLAGRTDQRIAELLDAEIARWSEHDPDLRQPLEWLRDLVLATGKRLRPAFCHWAFVGAGGDASDPAITDAGAALELVHSFALVHDDVMDASDRRRGMTTVHRGFESLHSASGWRGEGRRFGEGVGILVGDLAFVYADVLAARFPPEAQQVFTELRLEVNVGQYLDLLGAARGGVDVEQARRVSLYKSGKYTVERPLHLGAALAGGLGRLGGSLSAIGLPLGEAFQLRDDLIGAFGDTAVTGKPVGEDLREGKPTMLAALAVERACGPSAKVLDELLGRHDLDDGEVGRLQEVLIETGARRSVEHTVASLLDQALSSIEAAPLAGEARTELAELARFVATRQR